MWFFQTFFFLIFKALKIIYLLGIAFLSSFHKQSSVIALFSQFTAIHSCSAFIILLGFFHLAISLAFRWSHYVSMTDQYFFKFWAMWQKLKLTSIQQIFCLHQYQRFLEQTVIHWFTYIKRIRLKKKRLVKLRQPCKFPYNIFFFFLHLYV